jgi:hypothetical protein
MSLPAFLLPESVVHENGHSPILDLGADPGPVLITLGILEVVEQESCIVGIYGSADQTAWNPTPLIEFPQKFYTGVSAVYVPSPARFLRAQWKVDRWGRGSKTPSFRLYLFVEAITD